MVKFIAKSKLSFPAIGFPVPVIVASTLILNVFVAPTGVVGAPQIPTINDVNYVVLPASADRLDPMPPDAPIVFRHGDVSWLPAS